MFPDHYLYFMAPHVQCGRRGPEQRAFPGCRFTSRRVQEGLLWPDVSQGGPHTPSRHRSMPEFPNQTGCLLFHNAQIGRLWAEADKGRRSPAKAVTEGHGGSPSGVAATTSTQLAQGLRVGWIWSDQGGEGEALLPSDTRLGCRNFQNLLQFGNNCNICNNQSVIC